MLPRAIDDAQKAFTEVLNRFSKEITELTKAKNHVEQHTGTPRQECYLVFAANHIDELLSSTFPLCACKSRIKLNPSEVGTGLQK